MGDPVRYIRAGSLLPDVHARCRHLPLSVRLRPFLRPQALRPHPSRLVGLSVDCAHVVAVLSAGQVPIGRLLHKMGYAKLSARPCHYARDKQAIMSFQKEFRNRVTDICAQLEAGAEVEIGWQDEARVRQKNKWMGQTRNPPIGSAGSTDDPGLYLRHSLSRKIQSRRACGEPAPPLSRSWQFRLCL